MLPPAQSVDVHFHGAFLTHPHWRLNERGQVTLNADCSEVTIIGETGRGIQRKPHALKIPTRFIVNVLIDHARVQFQVRDKMDRVGEDAFVLEFSGNADAKLFGELLPKAWVRQDSPVAGVWKRTRRTGWKDRATSPVLQVALVLAVAYGLTTALAWSREGAWEPAMESLAHHWGNQGAATRTGETWRLLSHLFIHTEFFDFALHLGGLLWWGFRSERLLGPLVWWFSFATAALLGGMGSVLWYLPENWTVGAGAALQGLVGASLVTLWLWRLNGTALPKRFARDLFIYEQLVIIAEVLLPGTDWAHLLGGLVAGGLVAWLSWRSPSETREGLPPRVGRALIVGSVLIAATWYLSPKFEYSPTDEARFGRWEEVFREEEERRLQRGRQLDVEYAAGQVDTGALLYESNRLFFFYRSRLSELNDLRLREGLRSDRRRDDTVEELRTKTEQARGRTEGLREIQRIRALANQHAADLKRALRLGGAAFENRLNDASVALAALAPKTEAGQTELQKILADWRRWQTPPAR